MLLVTSHVLQVQSATLPARHGSSSRGMIRSKRSTSSSDSGWNSSSDSSSSDGDEDAQNTNTSASGRAKRLAGATGSPVQQQGTPGAAAAQDGVLAGRALLPPLQSAAILPPFVRCQYAFTHARGFLAHWLGNFLRSAAPGTKVDVQISLAVHTADWDVDAYMSSHAPQHPSLTAQSTAPNPAAAVNSSQQKPAAVAGQQQSLPGTAVNDSNGHLETGSSNVQGANSDAATSMYGPFNVKAYLTKGRQIRLTVLPAADIMADYARGVLTYDVVLQQQVGLC